jgi:hypothetical protein
MRHPERLMKSRSAALSPVNFASGLLLDAAIYDLEALAEHQLPSLQLTLLLGWRFQMVPSLTLLGKYKGDLFLGRIRHLFCAFE